MTYKELQKQTVDELKKLGVHFKYEDRLALFFLRTNLTKLYGGDQTKLLSMLDQLVEMRKNGLEPPHKDGAYT
jgi:hypothetical protein